MVGEYIRLKPEDLTRAITDHEWARDMIDALWDAEDEGEARDTRLFDVDKAWHGIAFVLDRAGLPTAIVFGDEQVPGADDWGYGPPSTLSPERVRELAADLASLDVLAAVGAVSATDFVEAEIYPVDLWQGSNGHPYVAQHLAQLTRFFSEAAQAEMGMLVWLD